MIGRTVSRYHILEKLGEGGMGEVYLAEDTSLKRKVALKFLPESLVDNETVRRRFLREAKSAASLHHPYICTIHETATTDDGKDFIVMEYVAGQTLQQKLADGPLPVPEALRLGAEIAEALEEAHEKGMVHRDIKPANIMLTPKGHAKVMDFGLAKVVDDDAEQDITTALTQEGSTVGTLSYMSPEQIRGERVAPGSDIFSFGIVLYEMLTSVHPFRRSGSAETTSAILKEDPAPLERYVTEAPELLRHTVKKALTKDPAERYQAIREIRTNLNSLLGDSEALQTATTNRSKAVWMAGLGLSTILLLVLSIWWFTGSDQPTVGLGEISSIAVLPLDNLMNDPKQDYFVDGMHEALITELSRVGALRVVSRTSSMSYRNTEKSLPLIAQELNVDALVEGSVLCSEDTIRITVQLIAADPERHLWAESYERGLQDVLSLQSEVAKAITRSIRVALTPEEEAQLASTQTVDPAAHQAYLSGRYLWLQRGHGAAVESIEFFNQALDIAPDFALAYSGLADTYITAAHGSMKPREAFPAAQSAAVRALVLDDTLAQAYTAIADSKYHYDRDWEAAEAMFRQSLRLNPSHATTHFWYGGLLAALGRFDEAVQQVEEAQRLEPLSILQIKNKAWWLYYARRYDEAIDACKMALALRPEYSAASNWLSRAYRQKGELDQAIAVLQTALSYLVDDPALLSSLAEAYADTGRKDEARALAERLESLSSQRHVSEHLIALAYCALDDRDQAFKWLEKANEARDPAAIWLNVEPAFDRLRDDPRFLDLLRRMNLGKD